MSVTAPHPGSVAASEADEDEDEDEGMGEVKEEEEEEGLEKEEEEEEEHNPHASARYARLSARRMRRLLIMAAVSLNTMARATALIADALAEEAGIERVEPY